MIIKRLLFIVLVLITAGANAQKTNTGGTAKHFQVPTKVVPKKATAPAQIIPTVKQPVSSKTSYFTIVAENSENLVAVKDTLYVQLDKSLSFGTEPVSYLIRNVQDSKASTLKKINVVKTGGFSRVAVPLQNTVVGKGGSGMLTIGNAKKYYFVTFKRS